MFNCIVVVQVRSGPRSPLPKNLDQLQQGTIFMIQVLPTNVYVFSLTT